MNYANVHAYGHVCIFRCTCIRLCTCICKFLCRCRCTCILIWHVYVNLEGDAHAFADVSVYVLMCFCKCMPQYGDAHAYAHLHTHRCICICICFSGFALGYRMVQDGTGICPPKNRPYRYMSKKNKRCQRKSSSWDLTLCDTTLPTLRIKPSLRFWTATSWWKSQWILLQLVHLDG